MFGRRQDLPSRRLGEQSRAPKKTHVPDDVEFLTKSQIAVQLIDESMADGLQVKAWTFDENYGRDGHFLDSMDQRKLAFVGEVPPTFHVWATKPKVLQKPARNTVGRQKKYPRLRRHERVGKEVQNIASYSPTFRDQTAQRYRIRDTHKGPDIWDVKWQACYRKTHDGRLISSRCTLIIARNVLTGDVKYFISNRVPWRDGWTIRELLRIAFGRWKVEACFREAKEELGWDHFECRGWVCVHRHLAVTMVAQLFCARVRHQLCESEVVTDAQRLTLEQVRRVTDVFIQTIGLPPSSRRRLYEAELSRMRYHQERNAEACICHRKKRRAAFFAMGIDPDRIKSVEEKSP